MIVTCLLNYLCPFWFDDDIWTIYQCFLCHSFLWGNICSWLHIRPHLGPSFGFGAAGCKTKSILIWILNWDKKSKCLNLYLYVLLEVNWAKLLHLVKLNIFFSSGGSFVAVVAPVTLINDCLCIIVTLLHKYINRSSTPSKNIVVQSLYSNLVPFPPNSS